VRIDSVFLYDHYEKIPGKIRDFLVEAGDEAAWDFVFGILDILEETSIELWPTHIDNFIATWAEIAIHEDRKIKKYKRKSKKIRGK